MMPRVFQGNICDAHRPERTIIFPGKRSELPDVLQLVPIQEVFLTGLLGRLLVRRSRYEGDLDLDLPSEWCQVSWCSDRRPVGSPSKPLPPYPPAEVGLAWPLSNVRAQFGGCPSLNPRSPPPKGTDVARCSSHCTLETAWGGP